MTVLTLASFVEDRWAPAKNTSPLASAIDGATVALIPADPANIGQALHHARTVGGQALRRMSFEERGRMLRALAEALAARKEDLYELSFHTGATRNDSAIDIEGGIGTLFFYASRAKALGAGRILVDGGREAISKGNFAGQHILSPLRGAAVHINAYNFPVWGMLEKLAPTLLAGMPAIVKPASVTAWLTCKAFEIMIASGALPKGSLQLMLGPVGELFDALGCEDAVAFTGSAATSAKLRVSNAVLHEGTRFNAEQDSLNTSILGPDAGPDTPEFELFVKEVVREMTVKVGQKCTAIRRAMVPASMLDVAQSALVNRLGKVTIGDPRREDVRMGALAGLGQRQDVTDNIAKLSSGARIVHGGAVPDLIDADVNRGAFIAPTLLRCDSPRSTSSVHEIEAFGPVSTLMPYNDLQDATELARAGKGSLVLSLFTNSRDVAMDVVAAAASTHGRLMIVNRDCAADSTGHGNAMPHLLHGGPGRAGGGAELGGLIGMQFYMQRSAVQSAPVILDALGTI